MKATSRSNRMNSSDEPIPRKQVESTVSRDAQIEAFLDQIEGETLGEMMNYLSHELQQTRGDQSTSQRHLEVDEEDKIYDEMTKLTRSTVDR